MKRVEKSTGEHSEVPVVGIGYSAGGLEAILAILSKLPKNTGLAFVIIQHLQPDRESNLGSVLAKKASMPVKTIKNGMRVAANTLFVIPPGCDVVLSGDFLNLNKRGESEVHQLGIDFFFASLSQNRSSKAIGVLLSGAGADGTLGLKAIKAEGGVTIVQDPKTAKFDAMPRSAIASGIVDLILSPEQIATELVRLAKHPYTKAALTPAEHSDSAQPAGRLETPSLFDKIIQILFDHTKIDFSLYKSNTIRRRIERQMMLRKIETVDKYAAYLQKNADEVKALYEDIFIHVTDFFRDPDSFEALKEKVFPEIVKEKTSDLPIRIWVPGCATGEEVYSLAILLTEYLEENSLRIPMNFFASDISEPALQKARRGVYSDNQMRSVSRERLEKFFDPVKGGFKIKKEIRDVCIFARHDVASNPPIPRVDLISCRNVLIYFSSELQKRLFPVFHYALVPTGYLWLGRAENPTNSKLFIAVDKVHKIFTKARGSVVQQHLFSAPQYGSSPIEVPFSTVAPAVRNGEMARNADQLILYKYSPPSVLIDSAGEILQFRGRTVPYLEPSPGVASHNLLKMANPEISGALRICLQLARKENVPARKENVEFHFEDKVRKANIDVSPLNPSAAPRDRQFLVVFEDAATSKISKSRAKTLPKARGPKDLHAQLHSLTQYNTQLQQELESAREYQQSLAEEYEATQEELTSANEELRSTNEELQSTNEELHSTNEELGSAKEELQAANEELLSTNEELQKRNEELEKALREVEISERRFRMMVSAVKDYAIFMLDPGGNVTSWNEGAQRINGYRAEEIIGSHFSRFYPPEAVARRHPEHELEVARKEGVYEEEGWRVRKDGSSFWASVVITAIHDREGRLLGFTKVTRDLTERRNADERLRKANESLEKRVHERTQELSVLLEASEALSKSLDYKVKLQDFAKVLVHNVASWCSIAVAEPGFQPQVVAAAHPDPHRIEQVRELFRDYPQDWNASRGAPAVLRTGKPELYPEISDELLQERARDPHHLELMRTLQMRSAMIVPLIARGRSFGVITLISTDPDRKFQHQDLVLAMDLARRAAISVDNSILYAEAQKAVRLRDEFLSIASHELKTPLTSLQIQVQMRRRNLEKGNLEKFAPEKLPKLFADDERQISRLHRLVEDMLDISRISSGKFHLSFEETNLGAVVSDVLERFSAQLQSAGIAVELDLPKDVVGCWDRYRLEQVFTNLLTNAIKYGEKKSIQIRVGSRDGKAVLSVRDQGMGIAEADQSRIFMQFERAVSPTGITGLGLGLYIVKQIVEAHGGGVRVESELGKGSTFTVEIPLEARHKKA